jgi:Acyl carrier protein
MANYWAGILKISPALIGLSSHFVYDLGGDSLGLIDLIQQLEKAYALKMNTDQIRNHLTLKEMTDYLKAL